MRAQIGYTPYSYMSGDQGRYLAPGITVVSDTTYNHPWRYEHVQPPNRISWVAARAPDGAIRSFLGSVRHQHQVCLSCNFRAYKFEHKTRVYMQRAESPGAKSARGRPSKSAGPPSATSTRRRLRCKLLLHYALTRNRLNVWGSAARAGRLLRSPL